jgi:hypothetical protein
MSLNGSSPNWRPVGERDPLTPVVHGYTGRCNEDAARRGME